MAQEIADSKLIDTWSSSGLIVKPDISKIIEGWQLGEQPPHEYMNWLQNAFGSKLNHILKNGVAKWNDETEYLAGSSVQHNGNVWLCKATNTNSEPTDANANWKRIITVESLTTVLGGYVKNSGNETIAGVKTFSSNPISTATQSTAVNALTRKDYVDGLDAQNVKLTGNQTIAGIKTFSSSPIVPTPTTGTQAVNKNYVDANAGISLATANSYDLGVGQTWQDVTASRVAGATYTNSTGKPIQVSIALKASTSGTRTYIQINGVDMISTPTFSDPGHTYPVPCFIVPNGATYKYPSGTVGIIEKWSELF